MNGMIVYKYYGSLGEEGQGLSSAIATIHMDGSWFDSMEAVEKEIEDLRSRDDFFDAFWEENCHQ